MPPSGGMTVSMSADDLSAVGQTGRKKSDVRQSVVQATGGRFASSEDVRYRKIRERSLEKSVGRQAEAARGGSWNRRQKRGESKERGGTQLPTWAETRTTRLRRSKALGETPNATQNKKPQKKPTKSSQSSKLPPAVPRPPPSYHDDSEKDEEREEDADEIEEFDDGHVLMERIRANSRCLKAQVSARERRTVANTGTRGPVVPPGRNKDGKGANGVYTMHARRNLTLRGGGTNEVPPEIESTVIRLVDAEGREIDGTSNEEGREDETVDEPEVVHHHTLAVDGRDGREFGNNEGLPNISENGNLESKTISEADSEDNNNNNSYGSPPPLKTAATPETEETSETDSSNNFLEEGRLVNQNGKLTIEVEVKELENTSEDGSSTSATIDQQNLTPVVVDESNEFDSYRVYSEQNLLTPSDVPQATLPQDQTTSFSRRSSRVDDPVRLSRAKQARGVYLRRMEHQNNSNSRTQAIEGGGGSPARRFGNARSVSRNRKSGRAKLEKWSTTAASTGDLRDAAWDYSNDKDRLLTILSEVRNETLMRQRQREELLRKIKQLQSRAHQRREQGETSTCLREHLPHFARRAESAAVREMWRKRYLEAKKITPRLEEECSKLRQELEKLHRELLAKVQAGVWALLTISGKTERPSNKLSYKIMIARLLQEIEDLTRRVEGTRLKLHTEVKLRTMAEKDVRNLREELLKKKIQVSLTRNQEQAAIGNGLRQQYFISAMQ